ncbi:hypothetical protein [Desulfogranum marinum]|uniref:hypothetical protein n=1 Tax=Desulfogranum marinum TaxID=453220 RepID=UPI0029C84D7D|nr:hypothetical protein [Desulfogranum marinum]
MKNKSTSDIKSILNVWGGVASCLGLVFTLIVAVIGLVRTDANPQAMSVICVLAVSCAFLGVLGARSLSAQFEIFQKYGLSFKKIKRLKKELSEKEQELKIKEHQKEKMAQIFHNFNHEYRKIVVTIHSDIAAQSYGYLADRRKSLKMFFIFALSNIKELFDTLTEDDCAVTLKLIENADVFDKDVYPDLIEFFEKEEDIDKDFIIGDECLQDGKLKGPKEFLLKATPIISTFLRDPITYTQRNKIDNIWPAFPYYKNAAFYYILSKDHPQSAYSCNDLKKSAALKEYWCGRNEWENHYNASLVTPIRYVPCDIGDGVFERLKSWMTNDSGSSVIGFICIDNMKGNLESQLAIDTLAAFGDSCYHLFNSYNRLVMLSKEEQSSASQGEKEEASSAT